ncbi:hypothetical protein ACEUZ9_002650 [Paracoccus litorisediminis]|uniref:Uncharacterized protein n=1 Tax=Paracoccus litorisediminis TaxID=2006130 RepID=A0A844HTX1_9RHOB|nr:hypothetical protein [Paracoccus litorisediminis]MTH60972.1 hypothetical protein [Paracoccus litorisediminis]
MAAIVNPTLRKTLDHRRKAMSDEYSYWESHFRELRDAILPTRGRFDAGERRASSSSTRG